MPENIEIKLNDVQITLLLPLWGRAKENQKLKPLLVDKFATEIISKLDYNFSKITKNTHPISQFEWIARSIHIDRTIKEFLYKYPKATIINIGCGLDTTFERVDNGSLYWYDLDLPEVIELRKKFIFETERRKFISHSFLDESWFCELHIRENILFIAAGVMYYFNEAEIKDIFYKINSCFPGSEFVFDAASSFGVKAANKKVILNSGFNESAFLKWGLENAVDIQKWNNRIEIIKEYPMFNKLTSGLSLRNKITAFISDRYKIMYMVHLKFLNN
jgi:O-methyltransferase involved in polyketide biosynthesis